MALGLVFGRDRVNNPDPKTPEAMEQVLKFREMAWRFCEEFKKVFGSTMCGDIRPRIMGRDYNSMDPIERQQFLDDDGLRKCRVPPETAARIAASILLDK